MLQRRETSPLFSETTDIWMVSAETGRVMFARTASNRFLHARTSSAMRCSALSPSTEHRSMLPGRRGRKRGNVQDVVILKKHSERIAPRAVAQTYGLSRDESNRMHTIRRLVLRNAEES